MKVGDILKCKKEHRFPAEYCYCLKDELFKIEKIDKNNGNYTFCVVSPVAKTGTRFSITFFQNPISDEEKPDNFDNVFYIWEHFESKLDRAKKIIKKYEER